MKRFCYLLFVSLSLVHCKDSSSGQRSFFKIKYTEAMSAQQQDGRLLLMLSKNDKDEPRNQINDGLNTQLIFGIDVEGIKPGDDVMIRAIRFSNRSNYRVQRKVANPEPVAKRSGISHRWIDVSEHQTKSEANRVRQIGQRVIKICSPSEGALLMSKTDGRRYNLVTEAEKEATQ